MLDEMPRGRRQYLLNCFIPLGDGADAQGIRQPVDHG